jgi:hypothetical protein
MRHQKRWHISGIAALMMIVILFSACGQQESHANVADATTTAFASAPPLNMPPTVPFQWTDLADEQKDKIYEDAVAQGYSGPKDVLLEALRPSDTSTAVTSIPSSAYQVAVDGGFRGTYEDWENILTEATKPSEPVTPVAIIPSATTSNSSAIGVSAATVTATTVAHSSITIKTTVSSVISTLPNKTDNIFSVNTEEISGDQITVSVKLDGTVNVCGFDMKLKYDQRILQLTSLNTKQCMSVIANNKPEIGELLFSSALAENQTDAATILLVSFKIANRSAKQTTMRLEAIDVFAINDLGEPIPARYTLQHSTFNLG